MVWLVAAKIAGIALLVDTLGVQSFDFPKTLYSHAVAWFIAAVLGAAIPRFRHQIVPRSRLHLVVFAFIGANVLAALFAEDHYVALFGEWKRYLGLTFVLDMVILYFAVATAFRKPRDWIVLGVAAACATVAMSIYAFVQRAGLDPVRWADDPQPRPFATMGQPDIYGQYLSVAFATGLGIALFVPARAARLVGAAVAVLALATSAIVATRGSTIGMGAAILVAVPLWLFIHGFRRLPIMRSGLGLAAVVAATAAIVLLTPLGDRVRATLVGTQVTDRLLIYRSAFNAYVARPILGWGPDGTAAAYPSFTFPETPGVLGVNPILSSAHSWPLQAAVTTGTLGLAALIALIVAGTIILLRMTREAAWLAAPLLLASVAYWAHGLVTVGSISVDWIPWVVLGAAASRAVEPVTTPRTAHPRPWAEGLVLGVCAVGLVLGYPAWAANRDALAARVAVERPDGARAVAAARSAIAEDRGRSTYWSILGRGLDLQGQWKAAGDAYAEAASRAPYDPTTWESLAVSRTRQAQSGDGSSGGEQAALDAARQAVRRDANNAGAHVVLAQLLTAFGHFDQGLAEAVIAIRQYPADPRFDAVAAQAAGQAVDKSQARELVESALAAKESVTLEVVDARLALQLGDRAAAIQHATRALQLAPDNAEAKDILRMAGG
ncbi:MAG TPA: O-antigen ligase family protein [Candidatus Limnocylindria bacterium]|nr:O-antigen ligase family protein [Candidatus Limnocylindria bacterium]